MPTNPNNASDDSKFLPADRVVKAIKAGKQPNKADLDAILRDTQIPGNKPFVGFSEDGDMVIVIDKKENTIAFEQVKSIDQKGIVELGKPLYAYDGDGRTDPNKIYAAANRIVAEGNRKQAEAYAVGR